MTSSVCPDAFAVSDFSGHRTDGVDGRPYSGTHWEGYVHRNRQATPAVIRPISMYPPWTANAPSSPVVVRMNLTSARTATRRARGTQTPPPRCIAGNVLAMGSRPASVLVVRTSPAPTTAYGR